MVDLHKILKDSEESTKIPEDLQEMLLDRIWKEILEWILGNKQTEENEE